MWLRQVERGRHGGWCTLAIISISYQTIPGTVNDERYWHCLANTFTSNPWTDSTIKKGLRDPPPPVCLPFVYTWCIHMWPNLPGLPPPYLHTASNQILEVGRSLSIHTTNRSIIPNVLATLSCWRKSTSTNIIMIVPIVKKGSLKPPTCREK